MTRKTRPRKRSSEATPTITESANTEPLASPRERADAAFGMLKLPGRVSVKSLVTMVEKSRKTRITITASPLLNGTEICGLWLPREKDDLIFHAETDSEFHRQQIVCHELSHMILRHDEMGGPSLHSLRLTPGDESVRAFGRSDFRDEFELAAEALADRLANAIRTSTREPASFEGVFG